MGGFQCLGILHLWILARQLSLCRVAALKSLPVRRYSIVIFTFSGASFMKGHTAYFIVNNSYFPLLYIRFTKFVRRNLFDETGPRSFGTLGLNTFIWEQSCAQPGARRCERCCICHYLSRTDSIKPSLLFSNFGCCISKGSPFRLSRCACSKYGRGGLFSLPHPFLSSITYLFAFNLKNELNTLHGWLTVDVM